MAEKILITGSSGFVGSHLIEEAVQRGLEVYAGIRSSSSRKYLQNPEVNFLELDLSDSSVLASQLTGYDFDYIMHNAGITKAPSEAVYLEVNKDYTQNLIFAIQQTQGSLKKFCFTSSIAAYGPADQEPTQVVHNNMNPGPVTAYGRSKLAAEKLLREKENLPYIIIRPTAVYGPRDVDFLTLYQTIKKGIGGQIGFKEQYFSFIYVEDLASIMLEATLSEHTNKCYFASDGKKYKGTELNELVAKSIGKKIKKIKIPLPVIKAVAGVNELYSRITGKATILNFDKVNELKALNWYCDIEPLQNDYNFLPKYYLKEGIEKTTGWYKEQNLI